MNPEDRARAISVHLDLGGVPLERTRRTIGFERKPVRQGPAGFGSAWGTAPDERERVSGMDWIDRDPYERATREQDP